MWLFDFRSHLHRTKWTFLPYISSWFKMPWQAFDWRLVVARELVFLIKIWIHIETEISKMHLSSFTRINFWSSNTTYNESIESLLGNSFLPALSKDRRRPLKIRQIYTMNKALCEFNENLVDKTTGNLNTDNVATYINQLGSGRRIKSQNERDINYFTILTSGDFCISELNSLWSRHCSVIPVGLIIIVCSHLW